MVSTNLRGYLGIFGVGLTVLSGCASANEGAESDSRQESAALTLAAPGTLDPSFGTAGQVVTDFSSVYAYAPSIVVQRDGKIAVGGGSESSDAEMSFALARYDRNGALDPSFGVDGKVLTSFPGDYARGYALAVQSDDKLILAGIVSTGVGIVRYRRDGSLDPSFGSGGRVLSGVGDTYASTADAVAVQEDDKIIVAGGVATTLQRGNNICLLARYDRNGALDSTFGTNGKVVTDFGGQYQGFKAVAVQADGKIVATGSYNTSSSKTNVVTARYNRDGSLDTSFGTGGKVLLNLNGFAGALALQRDGKIIVAGTVSLANSNEPPEALLVRFDRTGAFDPTFGDAGLVLSQFDEDGYVAALVIEDNGEIVAAGALPATGTSGVLARYSSQGVLDPNFGVSATAVSSSINPSGAVLAPNGDILVVGNLVGPAGAAKFGVESYLGGGACQHPSFDPRHQRARGR